MIDKQDNTNYTHIGDCSEELPKPIVMSNIKLTDSYYNDVQILATEEQVKRIEAKLDVILKLLTDENGNPKHSSRWCWKD